MRFTSCYCRPLFFTATAFDENKLRNYDVNYVVTAQFGTLSLDRERCGMVLTICPMHGSRDVQLLKHCAIFVVQHFGETTDRIAGVAFQFQSLTGSHPVGRSTKYMYYVYLCD